MTFRFEILRNPVDLCPRATAHHCFDVDKMSNEIPAVQELF
jgi:hypothetical protein